MPLKHTGKSPEQQFAEMQRFCKRLPNLVAREAVNFAKDRFRFGGWVDTNFKKWKPRSYYKGRQRALLIKSGRLRNSVHASSISNSGVTITANMPYAQAHNEGFKGTVTQKVKAHRRKMPHRNTYKAVKGKEYKRSTRLVFEKQSSGVAFVKAFTRVVNMNIPQRQFMGDSVFFMKRLCAIFTNRINQIER
jgi:phage gpG-like protein